MVDKKPICGKNDRLNLAISHQTKFYRSVAMFDSPMAQALLLSLSPYLSTLSEDHSRTSVNRPF
jgi:hypothetical protein